MRAIFSIIGLLVVLAIIGLLVKTQLRSTPTVPAETPAAATQDADLNQAIRDLQSGANGNNAAENTQNVQQQYKNALEGALQQGQNRMQELEAEQ